MKPTDSVIRERWGSPCKECGLPIDICEICAYAERYIKSVEKIDYHKRFKAFLSYSLDEARREEQERILTMAHNIRSELKEPGYISLTRLEDLLTGDNQSK